MRNRGHDDTGETLLEIMFAIVILGLVVAAFFAAIVTASNASKAHRDFVSADTVLRNAAELTKTQVRNACSAGSTYSVDFSTLANGGVTPPANISGASCPGITAPPSQVTLTVSWSGHSESLVIEVRSP